MTDASPSSGAIWLFGAGATSRTVGLARTRRGSKTSAVTKRYRHDRAREREKSVFASFGVFVSPPAAWSYFLLAFLPRTSPGLGVRKLHPNQVDVLNASRGVAATNVAFRKRNSFRGAKVHNQPLICVRCANPDCLPCGESRDEATPLQLIAELQKQPGVFGLTPQKGIFQSLLVRC